MNETIVIPDAPLEVLQWAERHAEGAQKQLLESSTLLHQQASTTVALLIAGLGAALSFAVRIFEPPSAAITPVAWGAAAVCMYFAALVVFGVRKCLAARPIALAYNEPVNLVQPGFTLQQLLAAELGNRQAAITSLLARNSIRGRNLNMVRLAAAAVPLVFVLAALLARCWLV